MEAIAAAIWVPLALYGRREDTSPLELIVKPPEIDCEVALIVLLIVHWRSFVLACVTPLASHPNNSSDPATDVKSMSHDLKPPLRPGGLA